MIFARQELYIVPNKVSFVDKIFFHDLFEYVFFSCHYALSLTALFPANAFFSASMSRQTNFFSPGVRSK